LRKLITAAVVATASLALAGGAFADPNDDQASLTVKATPKDAGTTKKPTNVKLTFGTKVNLPGTTVNTIQVLLPSGLKFSGKGFKKCNLDDLAASGPSACPSGSKAGSQGTANALVDPANAPLNFEVFPFVGNSTTLYFYLDQQPVGVQSVVQGKITNSGRTLTITIPQELRQPGGLDATLTGISQTFSGKAKKNYIVSSTKCPKGGWKVGSKFTFATRVDGTPPPAPESREVKVKCSK
jgi:hypothetical protein